MDGSEIGAAIIGAALLLMLLTWIAARLRNRADDRLGSRKVEAELVDASPPTETRQCRACKTTTSLSGWRRPSTIAVMGGFVGWSRRIRGLPPLYTLDRPPFSAEDLCAECSHVRDTMIDEKINESNLAIFSVSKYIAHDVQRFMVSLDDALAEQVSSADPRKRKNEPPRQSIPYLSRGR